MNAQSWFRAVLAGAAILAVSGGVAVAQSEMTDKIRLENNGAASNKYDFSVVGGNLGITRTDGNTVQQGQVGIGTTTPGFDLHILGNDADTRVFVENTAAAGAEKVMFTLKAESKIRFALNTLNNSTGCVNSAGRCIWTFDNDNAFTISDAGDGVNEFILNGNGNLTITGALTQNSDVNNKTDIVSVSDQAILDKLAALKVVEWSYKEEPGVRHLGPTAQDFHAAFGYGPTERGITAVDADGVSLASIKALYDLVQSQNAELAQLRGRLESLEKK